MIDGGGVVVVVDATPCRFKVDAGEGEYVHQDVDECEEEEVQAGSIPFKARVVINLGRHEPLLQYVLVGDKAD